MDTTQLVKLKKERIKQRYIKFLYRHRTLNVLKRSRGGITEEKMFAYSVIYRSREPRMVEGERSGGV